MNPYRVLPRLASHNPQHPKHLHARSPHDGALVSRAKAWGLTSKMVWIHRIFLCP